MCKINLNRREVERLYEIFNKLHETGDFGCVVLEQQNDSGIGSILNATFQVTHKDIEGDLTVCITDESEW